MMPNFGVHDKTARSAWSIYGPTESESGDKPVITNELLQRPLRSAQDLLLRTGVNLENDTLITEFLEKQDKKTKTSQTEYGEFIQALDIYKNQESADNLIDLIAELSDIYYQLSIFKLYADKKPNNGVGYKQELGEGNYKLAVSKLQAMYSKAYADLKKVLNSDHIPVLANEIVHDIAWTKYSSRVYWGKLHSLEKLTIAKYLCKHNIINASKLTELTNEYKNMQNRNSANKQLDYLYNN